jgi:murein DD-endopeptidase MepM/ murein hydrolase activator NlpD
VGPPTPSPTPAPRTVVVPADIPNYQEATDHFWFTRPFTEAYPSWGSFYYPYGTNGDGQYFWHFGIDIQSFQGQPIVAVGDGTVVHAGPDTTLQTQLGPWPNFYGQAVVIEHAQRWENKPVYTLYGHVSQVLVQVGQQVKAGQPIARVGGLGVATGPHLHVEVRLNGNTYYHTRNPDLWIRPDPGYGVIAGRVVDYQNYFVPQQLVTLHRENEPRRFWRQTSTYPDNQVNSDDRYVETFAFADVPAGKYLLKTTFDGYQLSLPVTVTNGATSFVLFQQTQPPKVEPAPTPAQAVQTPPTDQPQN